MSDNPIILSDRIKQYSLSTGTGHIFLSSNAAGFSPFNSHYNSGDALFYAVTDGSKYEIGSGIFHSGIAGEYIQRFPFRTSSNNVIIDFPAGTKEVYVTYPATHSVYIGSGVSDFSLPKSEGVAFWSSPNMLDYDENIIWKKTESRLGILKNNPDYAIDIGGSSRESSIKASGLYIGNSGIFFPSGNNGNSNYPGGRQLTHYEPNQLDDYAYNNLLISNLTGSSEVIELSGLVNQYILFKKQDAGTIFAGPASGCTPPCSPGYPSFRTLTLNDFPFLEQVSGILNSRIFIVSGIAQYGYDSSGVLRSDLSTVSGIAQYGYDSSGVLRGDLSTVSGIAQYGYDSSGILQNTISNLSGVFNGHTHGNISNSGTIGGSGLMAISDNNGYLITSDLPAIQFKTISNSNDVGRSGEIAFDSNYVYFHVPSGDSPTQLAWKRTNINIW